MKKQNVRTLSLIVVFFTFLVVGASIFDKLESKMEQRRYRALCDIENMIRKKYRIETDDYKIMETIMIRTEPYKAGSQWTFLGSLYYATTVLTTIGYGHSAPCTMSGKIFTMCYAMIGIPLGLVMFQSIGERVNRLYSIIIMAMKKRVGCKNVAATELNLILAILTSSTVVILTGAAVFSSVENWTYLDSVYYCFITLTTIGFGDMVAMQKENAVNYFGWYFAFTLVFILFGFAIVAATLNLLVLRFVTMNTEDERRDQAQAQQAAHGAVRLEGDIITAEGMCEMNAPLMHEAMGVASSNNSGTVSMCECNCCGQHRECSTSASPALSDRDDPSSQLYYLPHSKLLRPPLQVRHNDSLRQQVDDVAHRYSM